MAINDSREKEVRKMNCDQRKIYNKKAKEILCCKPGRILHTNNFKAQIKELYKKMDVKIEETSKCLDGLYLKPPIEELSRKIELTWNKMNGKIIRDWHKLGVKMDHTIKDIAKDH